MRSLATRLSACLIPALFCLFLAGSVPAAESENYNGLTLTGSEQVLCGDGTSDKFISITVVMSLMPTQSRDVYLVSGSSVDTVQGHVIGRSHQGETTCSWDLTSASARAQGGALVLVRYESDGPVNAAQVPLVGLSLQWEGGGDCTPPSTFSIGPVSDGGSGDDAYIAFETPLVHMDNLARERGGDINPWVKGMGTYDDDSGDCRTSRTYTWMIGRVDF